MRYFDVGVSTLLAALSAIVLVPSCGDAASNSQGAMASGGAAGEAGDGSVAAGSSNKAGNGGTTGVAGSAEGGASSGQSAGGAAAGDGGTPSVAGEAGEAGAGGQGGMVSSTIAAAYDIVEVKGPMGSTPQNRGINDGGMVVGRYYQGDVSVTYSWTVAGGLKDISGANGYSLPLDVNDLGVLVAYEGSAVATRLGFSTLGGTYEQLPNIMGYPYFSPEAVNDANVIVGGTAGANHRGFLFEQGKYTLLELLPNGTGSYAQGINENGTIVGWATDKDGSDLPVVFDDNVPQPLGSLGGAEGYANAINDLGAIVGYAQAKSGDWHAFYHAAGEMKDLGTLGGNYSYAASINNGNVVVGNSTTAMSSTAFGWSPTDGMVDLAKRLDGATGWVLAAALDINSSGQIVGYGSHDGAQVGFVMTPKP